jgi:hypothetical protein
MDTIGLWQILETGPTRLQAAEVAAERDLEEWIERDPALLERGLVIVGRQIRLEGGPLDLLALDPQGRWVLIEIKRERLRREVIAQAIDYASCLYQLDLAWLGDQCNDYLRSRGRGETLEALLGQRGRSLQDETDGRDVVIYLVGTGHDMGLERMGKYLAEQAQLSLRIVTFSVFRDGQGKCVLARAIHEAADMPLRDSGRTARTRADPRLILAEADEHGVGEGFRVIYNAAAEVELQSRRWGKGIGFSSPTQRSRVLVTLSSVAQPQGPGVVKAFIDPEAFQQVYGIAEKDLAAAVGAVEEVLLDKAGAERVAAGLRKLLAAKENG